MKRKTFILFLLGILASCEYNDLITSHSGLVGKWKLVEMLADPGDGSGVFTKVTSDKTISFYSDSTFYSNGSMCQMSVNVNPPTTGRYSPKQNTITPIGCGSSPFKIRYTIEDDYLIVYYGCIEACAQKFAKD